MQRVSPVAPHSYYFFLVLDFRCICLRQIRKDVEEVGVGVVQQLVDERGTTNGK